MFREICNLEDVIRAVALERILFEYIPDYGGDFIDGDQFYFQANEIVLALAQFGYYLDHTESTLYFFRFDEMDMFYDLCKEHSRRNKVNFKKDPYVKAAHDFVMDTIRHSGMENIAWAYWIPPKLYKGRQHRILIETGCYFMEWLEMVETIFAIQSYFKRKVEELKLELYPKQKVITFPVPIAADTEERKAA